MAGRKATFNKKGWIAGLEKGLQIIEAFNETHPRLTAARHTVITRTATRRYLRTLEHLGYVQNDGHLFWLTPNGQRAQRLFPRSKRQIDRIFQASSGSGRFHQKCLPIRSASWAPDRS